MATKRWKGDAVAVRQAATITVADTWANGDTATLTVNGKSLTVTVGDDDAPADVARLLAEAFMGAQLTDPTASSVPDILDQGGRAIPEFAEIEASAAGAALTLRSVSAGAPFTVTRSETTAGDGVLGAVTQIAAATGPNQADDGANFDGGAVADGDDVVLEGGASLLYGLQQPTVTPASIRIAASFTAEAGLRRTNLAGYDEYRPRYVRFGDAGDTQPIAVSIGEGEGAGSGLLRLDTGDAETILTVARTGSRSETGRPALIWKGTHADNVVIVNRGDVGIAIEPGDAATVDILRVGWVENQAGDAAVIVGPGVALGDVEMTGGAAHVDASFGSLDMTGGTLTARRSAAATALAIHGGMVIWASDGTIADVIVGADGLLDFSKDMRPRTVTNCKVYRGATIHDPFKTVTFTSGIDLIDASPEDVTLNIGRHQTLTPSAI